MPLKKKEEGRKKKGVYRNSGGEETGPSKHICECQKKKIFAILSEKKKKVHLSKSQERGHTTSIIREVYRARLPGRHASKKIMSHSGG